MAIIAPHQNNGPLLTASIKKIAVASIFMLLSLPALSINPDSAEPIEIESEKATLNDKLGISTYEGDVLVKQGLSKMEADSIKVFSKEKRISKIEARGQPARYTQQLQEEQEATHAFGESITYDAISGTLIMRGGARFEQGQNSFEGEVIEYNIRERAVKAEGSSSGDTKVRIQYQPNSDPVDPTKADETDTDEDT